MRACVSLMLISSLAGCTVGKEAAPPWGGMTTDTGTAKTGSDSAEPAASDLDVSAAPGCDLWGVVCYLFTGPGWAGTEEASCAATADSLGQEMTYMPEGCPTGTLAYCELPAADGYPGTEYLLISYSGSELSSAESSCEYQGGTFTRL